MNKIVQSILAADTYEPATYLSEQELQQVVELVCNDVASAKVLNTGVIKVTHSNEDYHSLASIVVTPIGLIHVQCHTDGGEGVFFDQQGNRARKGSKVSREGKAYQI